MNTAVLRMPRRIREVAQGRGLLTLLLLALCLSGVVEIGRGLYIPAKSAVAQVLLDRAFDRSRIDHAARKPWPWADMTPLARLVVPGLGISRVVLDSGSGQALAFGPTMLPGAAALGQPGTAVIAAHRDTHFAFLRDVKKGDLLFVQTRDGLDRRYRVTGAEVVRWDRYALADAPVGERLDLVTCFPFDAIQRGPWRYVVHAEAVTR
ncbi:MAG: class sortase [Novosphingobium lindaniclasticum]|jgi:sortase A|uniref:class GN sortase n=1 Tax=Novosphingobium lindaniclasticum TaxID=1329895 RepID=UPI0024095AF4|nr:class GN sortase [Novosphingobium lindaniclasticum]MDF2639011.1 class sortase [Novosphingobium lindaniclasticum]